MTDHPADVAGQPQGDCAPRPSAAERAGTLIEGKVSAVLDIPGADGAGFPGAEVAARTVLPGGDVLEPVPDTPPAALRQAMRNLTGTAQRAR